MDVNNDIEKDLTNEDTLSEYMEVSDIQYKDGEANHIAFYEERKNALPHKRWWIALQIVMYLLVIVLAERLIIQFCFQSSTVFGTSMSPTLEEEDVVLLNKMSYTFGKPKRFDIVVAVMDRANDVNYVKRVIGLPGETIQIKDGKVYINGTLLEGDDYCADLIHFSGIATEPLVLGEDEYFLMGDNRNDSLDSRKDTVGVVSRKQILGKAIFRLRPFSKMGLLK